MTDAPERIWALMTPRGGLSISSDGQPLNANAEDTQVEYLRADLVPTWSNDMDAAPKDGTRVLTFHPGNPKSIIEWARRDNILWSTMKAGRWWHSLPAGPPTHWMPQPDPPKEGE